MGQARHPHLAELLERNILAHARSQIILILLHMGESIDFVKHHYHRFVGTVTHLAQRLVDHLDLLLEMRMRDVDHMHQQVGLAHLVESRLERIDKMSGQLAYETYGVGEQKRQIVDNDLAHRGVERGEKLVFGKHLALAQHIHQSRLAGIGIAHESHARELAAVFALHGLLLVDGAQLLLQQRYFRQDYTAVGLDLRLARAAHAYTAALAFEVSPHARKSRQQILILGQLDLRLGVGRTRTLGKDVEDETGTVKYLHLELALDIHHLF